MIKIGNFTWEAALLKIAKHYGYKEQLGQLQEECGELIAAAHKQTNVKKIDIYVHSNLVEEIADVEIMIEQIKLLYSIQNSVDHIKKRKVLRQLKRIKESDKESKDV